MSLKLRRVGIDWGSERHQVCRIDLGKEPQQRSFRHRGEDLQKLLEFVTEGVPRDEILVAIETKHGPVVEMLLSEQLAVYSINPMISDRLRDRFSPAGAKDDRRDAFVLAACVESDPHCFRKIEIEPGEVVRLRSMVRSRGELQESIRVSCNRLWTELRDYRPEALRLCPAADEPWFWDLIERAPDPKEAANLQRASIGAVLKRNRVRRFSPREVQEMFRQDVLSLTPGYIDARILHVRILISQLKLIHGHLKEIKRSIEKAIEDQVKSEEKSERRVVTILLSLPGVGPLTAATALAESFGALQRGDYNALRSLYGVAPVTKQSGQSRSVAMRYSCVWRLRLIWHHAALWAQRKDPKLHALYLQGRMRGHSVGRVARTIGDRLLGIAVHLLRRNELYDPALRAA
jgi:transposase